MEADLKPKKKHGLEMFGDSRYLEARSFQEKFCSRHKGMIFSTLVNKPSASGIVEILFVIDDFNNLVLNPQVEDMRVEASEIAYESSLPIKCDFLLASALWDGFKSKDAAVLATFRQSLVVHDEGFFLPLQDLLVTGKIRPSSESVKVYFVKAEQSLKNSNHRVERAMLDLYWAVIDSAHAAIMVAGLTPPSPKDLSEAFRTQLVARNLINRRCADIVDMFYTISKQIMHKERFEFSGKEFDQYLADADFFIKEVSEFIHAHVK